MLYRALYIILNRKQADHLVFANMYPMKQPCIYQPKVGGSLYAEVDLSAKEDRESIIAAYNKLVNVL